MQVLQLRLTSRKVVLQGQRVFLTQCPCTSKKARIDLCRLEQTLAACGLQTLMCHWAWSAHLAVALLLLLLWVMVGIAVCLQERLLALRPHLPLFLSLQHPPQISLLGTLREPKQCSSGALNWNDATNYAHEYDNHGKGSASSQGHCFGVPLAL